MGDGSKHECFFEAVNHFLGLKMNSKGNLLWEDFIQRLSSNQNKMLRCIVKLYDMNGEIFESLKFEGSVKKLIEAEGNSFPKFIENLLDDCAEENDQGFKVRLQITDLEIVLFACLMEIS